MIAAALVLAAATFAPGTDQSFESLSALPPDWQLVEYTPGLSSASVQTGDAAKGKRFLRLSASKPNHTRVFVPADVEPGAIYRFSARVRATGPVTVPAVLTLDGSNVTSESIPGDGKWHAARLYVRTGTSDNVTLVLSLGRFGQVVAGDADFDVLKLGRVDALPEGAAVADTATVAAAAPDAAAEPARPKGVEQGPRTAVFPLAALLLVLIAGCWRVLVRGGARDD